MTTTDTTIREGFAEQKIDIVDLSLRISEAIDRMIAAKQEAIALVPPAAGLDNHENIELPLSVEAQLDISRRFRVLGADLESGDLDSVQADAKELAALCRFFADRAELKADPTRSLPEITSDDPGYGVEQALRDDIARWEERHG
jgi:hypothetical protein